MFATATSVLPSSSAVREGALAPCPAYRRLRGDYARSAKKEAASVENEIYVEQGKNA